MNTLAYSLLVGDGVAQDGAEAVRLFEQAVAAGSADAARSLGRAYFRGRGVQYDPQKAFEWFQRETAMRGALQQPKPPLPADSKRVEISREEAKMLAIQQGQEGLYCPSQVIPQFPKAASRLGTAGEVHARVLLINGDARDVIIISGPKLLYFAVRASLLNYVCEGNGIADQYFHFSWEDDPENIYEVRWPFGYNTVLAPKPTVTRFSHPRSMRIGLG